MSQGPPVAACAWAAGRAASPARAVAATAPAAAARRPRAAGGGVVRVLALGTVVLLVVESWVPAVPPASWYDRRSACRAPPGRWRVERGGATTTAPTLVGSAWAR